MTLWLIITLSLASVAWCAVWARFPSKARWLAVAAFVVASPAAGASLLLSMGWAVPLYPVMTMPSGEIEVLGVKLVPEEAIYVMSGEPRLYVLPWNPATASKLQRMMEGAEGEGKIKAKLTGNYAPGEFYMEGSPMNVPEKPEEQPGMMFNGDH
jgi:hypothetical protein